MKTIESKKDKVLEIIDNVVFCVSAGIFAFCLSRGLIAYFEPAHEFDISDR